MTSKRKKIFRILIVGVGVLLVLLLGFQLILPKLINLESVKGKILASVSEKLGGEVKCGKVGLSLFPYPHAVIDQISLSIPGKVSGSLEALSVYAKLLPLLKGKLQIEEVKLKSPEFKLILTEKTTKKAENEVPTPSVGIPILVAQYLTPLILEAPDLEVEIKNGRLDLAKSEQLIFLFRDIDARIVLPPKEFKLGLSCTSNLWEKMGVKSTLNAADYKGEVQIELNRFQPHRITSQLFEDSPLRLADSSINMSVDLNVDGLNNLQAKVQGSIPFLSFQNGNEKLVIKGKSLKSLFTLDEDQIKFSLADLNLEYPKVNLSGSFLLGRRTPRVQVELQGRDVDVPTVREVALALAGDISDVQEIFGIVRGGKVPLVTVKSEGSTYDHVGDLKNILIKGNILEGKIMVPDVELDLADVKGDAVISEGVLHGENLEARVGNSWGREGKLKLGLGEDDDTFHLDIGVKANLAELPPIMRRLIEDKVFQEEMSLMENLKGNAEGRLVLGETTESVKAHVDVSKLNLSARYQRIPFPIVISGGQFSFDETRIAVKNMEGKLGKSSFSQLAAGLALKEKPMLDVTSGKIDAVLDEIHSWITSIEGSPVSPEDLKALKGTVSLTSLRYKGPLLKIEAFDFETTGEIKGVVVDSALLPRPIQVKRGSFHTTANATAQKGTLKHAQISFLDASLNVSGGLDDYFKGLNKVEATVEGDAGPEFMRWLSKLIHLPPELSLRTPLSVSGGHLVWEKDTKTSFKGNLLVHDGPKVSVDLLQNPQELTMKNTIRDEVSDASTALILRERKVDVEFKGNLKKGTLTNLFVKNGFLHGRLEGDFRAHISVDHPMQSTAQGHLIGEDLLFPWRLEIPLAVYKISLKAEERHVDLQQAVLISGSDQMALEGSLDFSPHGLVFNMDAKSNGITWTQIEKLLNKEGTEKELEPGQESWDLPIQGTLRLQSKYFNYDRFTWMPFHADITFAKNEINVAVIEATLCNISTPGTLKVTPTDLELDFQPTAKDQELDTTIHCIAGEEVQVTGNFDLEAKLMAQGKPEKLLESLEGNFEFLAGKGRVQKSVPFERFLAYLNVLGIIKGQLSEMREEGFAYNAISAKADLEDGKIVIQEGIIDGLTMDVTTRGNVDLVDKQLDLTLLVAIVKTVQTILQKIPVVRRIAKGGIIAVAIKVEGDFADPQYKKYPTSAVGSNLVEMMKRTAKLPFELIDVEPTGGAENIPMEPQEPKE